MPESSKPDSGQPADPKTVTACILVIGNEILSGKPVSQPESKVIGCYLPPKKHQ